VVKSGKTEAPTAEQVAAIISAAHAMGLHSIALAQAFQTNCKLRQKDVIGEWVPEDEPDESDLIVDGEKWLYGIRWSEIGPDLVLHHVTSQGGKLIEPRLSEAPLVMAEIARMFPPNTPRPEGPVIVSELTGWPWKTAAFRQKWREVARAAGVPDTVRNADNRGGNMRDNASAGHAKVGEFEIPRGAA
jgi:hypothetical protein